jgi:hypothetical protein
MDIVVPSARAADARLRRSGTREAGRSHGIAPSLTGRRTTCCVVRGCWWPTTSMLKAREVRTIRVIVTAHAPHLATDGQARNGARWTSADWVQVRGGAACAVPRAE